MGIHFKGTVMGYLMRYVNYVIIAIMIYDYGPYGMFFLQYVLYVID